MCRSKYFKIYLGLSSLLLIGLLHVVHAFKMREEIHLFLGNTCFISQTSKALNCLDNSTCQDGNSFEVLCSRPFPEPGLGEQSQEKQAFLQAVPMFLLYRAAGCQFGLFRCSKSHQVSDLLQAGSARRMIPAHTERGTALEKRRCCSCLHRRNMQIGTGPKMLPCSWKRTS